MTDIVERLREWSAADMDTHASLRRNGAQVAEVPWSRHGTDLAETMMEAAAEIERLRAASEMPWHLPLRAMMKLKMATAEFYGAPPSDQMLAQWWRDMWEAENDVR